jgi:hypothetical protein
MLTHIGPACGAILSLVALCGSALAGKPPAVRVRFSMADPADDSPVTIKVSGKIIDARTEQPIPGALVRGYVYVGKFRRGPEGWSKMPCQETRSDNHGAYALRFFAPLSASGPSAHKDNVRIAAGASGYETRPLYVPGYVSREHAELTGVNLALKPGKLLHGKALDEQGRPVEGAAVRIQNGQNADWTYFNSLGLTKTAADGRFQMWISTDRGSVISADPWLRIDKENYGVGFVWDLLKKDDLGTLVIRRGGTVVGRVLDAHGKAVPNCEVCVCDSWPNRLAQTRTDGQGKYELKGVPGGRVLKEFYRRKNSGEPVPELLNATVYARANSSLDLAEVPRYMIRAKDGATVTGPDLVIGREASVSGKLLPSKNTFGLKGILIRLDYDWDNMVEADAEGNFRFPNVPPGKHRLTAYLPINLRGDQGIGRAEVLVKPKERLSGIRIQLDTLTEVRVQFVDAAGAPLEGITAGATWNKNGYGFWTEGTLSDKDGWALLYLYPVKENLLQSFVRSFGGGANGVQYVRGFDHGASQLESEEFREVVPVAGKAIGDLRITMVPAASLGGQINGEKLPAFDSKTRLFCRLDYADGSSRAESVTVDTAGKFKIERLPPGVAKLSFDTQPHAWVATLSEPLELKPGQATEAPRITLKRLPVFQVSGRLLASPTFAKLDGFKIRVDLGEWTPMIATDAQGRFVLPKVEPGKHRLTAYLPFNLRTDRGVGHVDIEVKDGGLSDVQLPLETLAVAPVRIVDPSGKPLAGISAAAWWTENHWGVFTEGSKSGKDGRATLYLYSNQRQYVGAHDWSGKYRLKGHRVFQLKPGQTAEELTVSTEPVQEE